MFEVSKRPTPYEYVVAKTRRERYIGYVDHDGNWFRVADDNRLDDVIHWYPLYANTKPAARN